MERSLYLLLILAISLCFFTSYCNLIIAVVEVEEKPSTSLTIIDVSSDGTAEIQYPITLTPNNQSTVMDLFGRTSDVVVRDIEGNLIRSELKENLKEVEIDSSGLLDAMVYYNTSDLTKKFGEEWIFSLISPTRISLILPANSYVSGWEMENPLIIAQNEKRNIITFDPGNITVKYSIIEQPPTKGEATITINSAQIAIQAVKDKHSGIILTDAEKILQEAISAKDEKKYQEAIKLGIMAKSLLSNITREYSIAESEIKKADLLLSEYNNNNNGDKEAHIELLTNAKEEFTDGNYTKSIEYVQELLQEYESVKSEPSEKELWMFGGIYLYVVVLSLIVGVIVLIIYINRKGGLKSITITKRKKELQNIKTAKIKDQIKENKANLNPPDKDRDFSLSLKDSISSETLSPNSDIHNPQKDTTNEPIHILNIVERIIQERPYLKQEDKDVLKFIAEKEGTVFESEIRKKFILPKTTIWRLIRRLEREDLIEVRKAGVQNLIKLRYEDFNNKQST